MHKLLVLDPIKGHVEVEFAPPEVTTKEAQKSREAAKRIFDEVMARPGGWAFIAQKPEAMEGEKLTKFDPNVEEAVAILPVAGG